MRGLAILVTGATGGLGALVCKELVARGADVIAHCRSREALDALVAELGVRGVLADLASIDDTARLAREVGHVDVLVNNAGVGFGRDQMRRETSHDGLELRFAVNYLAPFILSYAMRDRIRANVQVASAGQRELDFDDLQTTRGYDGIRAYRRSKLAQVMLTFDLAELGGPACNALHPGTFLDTPMVRESGITPQGTAQSGADAILHVLERTLAGERGVFFDRDVPDQTEPQAYDLVARRRLRDASFALVSRVLPRP